LILSANDTLERAAEKLTEGNAGAATVLAEVILRCRTIDPACEHPAQILVQLDRYKVRGPFIYGLYEKVCDCDLVRMLAVLRWAADGRIRPSDVRAAITVKYGHLPPPWYRHIDPVAILSLVRAHYPTFGDR
jgi:hypothetical protein